MKNILVINALNGSIPLGLQKKYPSAKITCAEVFPFFKQHLTKLGFEVTDWTDVGDMKFDLVIGNPPFQEGLWKTFVLQACNLSNRHVCIVGPDSVTQYSSSKKADNFRKILEDNGIQSISDATQFFPGIQSGAISVFMMDKTQASNLKAFTKTGIEHTIVEKILSHTPHDTLSAILATQKANYSSHDRSDIAKKGYTKIVDSVSATGIVGFAWLKNYTNKLIDGEQYWVCNRFFAQSSNFAIAEFTGECVIGQNIVAIQKIDGLSVQEFKEIYGSKLIRFVLAIIRNGKFDTPVSAIKKLPIILDKNIYDYFGLTQAEIHCIEQYVK